MYSQAEKGRIAQARSTASHPANTSWQFAGRRPAAEGPDLLQGQALNGPQADSLRTLQAKADASPGVTKAIQLAALASSTAALRQAEDQEEPVQGRFSALQRQSNEEEEPLQGKFATIQRSSDEEEEPLQGRFAPVQRQQADEDEVQMKAADSSASSIQRHSDATATKNETGLPDNLKAGIESLSGFSMDSVRVHYNSSQPAQLNALAYAQGTDIHVAPGQERHLPHEAWHVVQQAQGRVKPTTQMKGGVPVNDDQGLEREADAMGAKAAQMKCSPDTVYNPPNSTVKEQPLQNSKQGTTQRKIYIENFEKKTIPGRENPALPQAASRYNVSEKRITDTLIRWASKNKKYVFPSWAYAFDEAARGKIKAAKGNTEKIEKLSQERGDELEQIADTEYKERLKEERKKLATETAIIEWESRSKERSLVNDLKKYARKNTDRIAAVMVDPDSLEIHSKGHSGELASGYKSSNNKVVSVGSGHPELATKLTNAMPTAEEWMPWHCGEAAAAHNALSNGQGLSGKKFLAGERGGAHTRKCACGNCSRWATELPKLKLGGELEY